MKTEEITLRDGETCCLLLLDPMNPEGPARIVGGDFGQPGDQVAKPEGITWEEGAELVAPNHTYLAPSDLDIREDGKTGWTQEEPEVCRLSEVYDPSDDAGPSILDIPAILIDEELARQVAEALAAEPTEIVLPDPGPHRRSSDQVA